jgi:hypothetical protein
VRAGRLLEESNPHLRVPTRVKRLSEIGTKRRGASIGSPEDWLVATRGSI